MKTVIITAALIALSAPAFAENDVEKGEKDFKRCKACHSIVDPDGEAIVKGGMTGPNLWGVVGRVAGTYPDFKYSDSYITLGEADFTWTPELLVDYITDPKAFLQDQLDDESAKTKMTFKMKKPSDVVAYLATFGAEATAESDGASDSDGASE